MKANQIKPESGAVVARRRAVECHFIRSAGFKVPLRPRVKSGTVPRPEKSSSTARVPALWLQPFAVVFSTALPGRNFTQPVWFRASPFPICH